jgi:hypothetical protein
MTKKAPAIAKDLKIFLIICHSPAKGFSLAHGSAVGYRTRVVLIMETAKYR